MKYYRPSEVASLLGVSTRTILNWVNEGKLPALRINRTIRIREDVLAELMDDEDNSGGTAA